MAIALVGALATTTATAISTGFATFAAAAKFFAVQAALGIAANALSKPKKPVAGGLEVTTFGANLDHQIVYGRDRIYPAVVADFLSPGLGRTDSEGRFLHRVLALTGHEIDGFERIYINSEAVLEWKTEDDSTTGITDVAPYVDSDVPLVPTRVGTLDSAGNVIAGSESDPYSEGNYIVLRFFSGSPNQTHSAALEAELPPGTWDSSRRLRGISYIYARFGYSPKTFPTGLPDLSALLRGRKVYDPRSATTAWSDNPALCLRDYLLDAPFGLREPSYRIGDDFTITAANVCDQTNTLSGAKRYTCNGSFLTDGRPLDIIDGLLTSMGGLAHYAQGKWRMRASAWSAPVLQLGAGDLRSSISVSTRHSRRDNFNRIAGTFKGPETAFAKTGFTPVESAAFLAEDNGQEATLDLELLFTNTAEEARRLARIMLERNRQQLTVSARWGIQALKLQPGDVVELTLDRFGWTAKTFEVTEWAFGLTEEQALEVSMTLREISEQVFDEVDDGAALVLDNTALPEFVYQLTVAGLSVSPSAGVATSSEVFSRALLSWDANASAVLSHYGVEWRRVGATAWHATTTPNNQIEIEPLEPGRNYEIRVRAFTAEGLAGAYATETFKAAVDTTPPPVPTHAGKSNEARERVVTIRWNNPATDGAGDPVNDRRGTEIWCGAAATLTLDGNGDPTNATRLDLVPGEEYIDTGGAWDTTYHYFLRALDWSGNRSAFDAGRAVTIQPEPNDEGVAADLTAPALLIPAASDGSNPNFTDATTSLTIFTGGADETGSWSISRVNGPGVSSSLVGATLTITGLTQDRGHVDLTATRPGFSSVTKRVTLAKVKAGAPGQPGTDGDPGDPGAPGWSYQVVFAYRRASSAPAKPTGGSYNFGTKALAAPTNWQNEIPTGTDPVYVSQATAAVQGSSGTDSSLNWSTPKKLAEAGPPGGNGLSVAHLMIFRRSQTQPSNPSGGSYDFSDGSFVLPSGWDQTPPIGTHPVWMARGTASAEGDGTDSSIPWSAARQVFQDGAPGTAGLSTYQAKVFKRTPSAPTAPFGGDFDFGANTHAPPAGWAVTPPAADGNPLWSSTALYQIQGDTGTDSDPTWSAPVVEALDGEDGDPGAAGSSFYQVPIYKRAASAPPTPSGGSYDFGANATTPPSGWNAQIPTGTNPLWVSYAVAQVEGATGTDGSLSWSTPKKLSQDGAPGDPGDKGDTEITGRIYYQILDDTQPPAPTATGYNVASGILTGLTANWSQQQPPVEVTDTTLREWSAPYTVTINGETGAVTIGIGSVSGTIQITSTMESDNFVAGISGARINWQTGDVEFNNGIFRGELVAEDIVVTGSFDGPTILTPASVLEGLWFEDLTALNITTENVWTQVGTLSFTDDGRGFAELWWTLAVKAENGGAGDGAYFDVRETVTLPGIGTSTRIFEDWGVGNSESLPVSYKFPFSQTTGRVAGTATITLEVQMTARSGATTIEVRNRQISAVLKKT